MKYEEILKDVLSGKSVRQSSTCRWIRLKESGMWDDGPHNPDFVLEKRDYAIDSWEVKPDEPEEIYLWGYQDSEEGAFIGFSENNITNGIASIAFPSEKKQKYKLVPMEEEIDSFEEWNKKQEEISEYAKTIGDNRWTNTKTSRYMEIAAVILQEREKAWKAALKTIKIRRGE